MAEYYGNRGALLGLVARSHTPLDKLSHQFPGRVHVYSLDVRHAGALQQAAAHFVEHCGLPDIVIASAGISCGTLTEFAEDLPVFQQIMDVNVMGMVNTFQPFLPHMKQHGRGTLVGIASVAGFRGLPGAGAYSASKAAAARYLESLRIELGDSSLRVVTINPGYVATAMTAVNPYRMPFLLSAEEAARRIARVIQNGKRSATIPWQMAIVGYFLKRLPEVVYDALFRNAPRKPRNLRL